MELTLTFRHVPRSGALEAHARELGSRLERVFERIARCHISLEGSSGTGNSGPYVVKIELTIPGAQIHADSLRADEVDRRDVYLAMREAYDDAKRQLQHLQHGRQ